MHYIHKLAEAIITVLFASILVVGTLQVFNRYVLNISLSWSEEYQKFAFVWLVFLAIPVAYTRAAHLRVDTFFDMFPQRLRYLMRILIDLLWIGLGVAFVFYTSQLMKVTRFQTSPGLGLSMANVYLGVLIGSAYLALTAFVGLVRKVLTKDVP